MAVAASDFAISESTSISWSAPTPAGHIAQIMAELSYDFAHHQDVFYEDETHPEPLDTWLSA